MQRDNTRRQQGGVRGGVQRFDSGAFRDARVAANISPLQLAALLGVSRQTVSRWESGEAAPTPGHLLRARAILNVTPEALGLPEIGTSTLVDLRERAGWASKALAAHLGIDPTTFKAIELGHTAVSDRLITSLAVALNVVHDDVRAAWQRSRDALTSRDN